MPRRRPPHGGGLPSASPKKSDNNTAACAGLLFAFIAVFVFVFVMITSESTAVSARQEALEAFGGRNAVAEPNHSFHNEKADTRIAQVKRDTREFFAWGDKKWEPPIKPEPVAEPAAVGVEGEGEGEGGRTVHHNYDVVIMATKDRFQYLEHILKDLSDKGCTAPVISFDGFTEYEVSIIRETDDLKTFDHDAWAEKVEHKHADDEVADDGVQVPRLDILSKLQELLTRTRVAGMLFHPGIDPDDRKLNEGYKGDTYGNPREYKIVRAKHHWWWMMNEVWSADPETTPGLSHEWKLFVEEDLVMGPDACELVTNLISFRQDNCPTCPGVALTWGDDVLAPANEVYRQLMSSQGYAFPRSTWDVIVEQPKAFCEYDDFNWDWTCRHILGPERLFIIPRKPRTLHAGICGGLNIHHNNAEIYKKCQDMGALFEEFHHRWIPYDFPTAADIIWTKSHQAKAESPRGTSGGWGHPYDHSTCLARTKAPSGKVGLAWDAPPQEHAALGLPTEAGAEGVNGDDVAVKRKEMERKLVVPGGLRGWVFDSGGAGFYGKDIKGEYALGGGDTPTNNNNNNVAAAADGGGADFAKQDKLERLNGLRDIKTINYDSESVDGDERKGEDEHVEAAAEVNNDNAEHAEPAAEQVKPRGKGLGENGKYNGMINGVLVELPPAYIDAGYPKPPPQDEVVVPDAPRGRAPPKASDAAVARAELERERMREKVLERERLAQERIERREAAGVTNVVGSGPPVNMPVDMPESSSSGSDISEMEARQAADAAVLAQMRAERAQALSIAGGDAELARDVLKDMAEKKRGGGRDDEFDKRLEAAMRARAKERAEI